MGHPTVFHYSCAPPQFSVTKISWVSSQWWDKNWEPVAPISIALQTKLLHPKDLFLNLSGVCVLNLSYWGKSRDTITYISVQNIIQSHTLMDLKTQGIFYFTKVFTKTFILESARQQTKSGVQLCLHGATLIATI